jgi:hypothetical protein
MQRPGPAAGGDKQGGGAGPPSSGEPLPLHEKRGLRGHRSHRAARARRLLDMWVPDVEISAPYRGLSVVGYARQIRDSSKAFQFFSLTIIYWAAYWTAGSSVVRLHLSCWICTTNVIAVREWLATGLWPLTSIDGPLSVMECFARGLKNLFTNCLPSSEPFACQKHSFSDRDLCPFALVLVIGYFPLPPPNKKKVTEYKTMI